MLQTKSGHTLSGRRALVRAAQGGRAGRFKRPGTGTLAAKEKGRAGAQQLCGLLRKTRVGAV